jgi:hypothetical protein
VKLTADASIALIVFFSTGLTAESTLGFRISYACHNGFFSLLPCAEFFYSSLSRKLNPPIASPPTAPPSKPPLPLALNLVLAL